MAFKKFAWIQHNERLLTWVEFCLSMLRSWYKNTVFSLVIVNSDSSVNS